jgi:hypothetical protein
VAIYHLSCKIICRSDGRSAVAAAAYRAGVAMENAYDGLVHDYTHKGGVVYSHVLLPENAPREYADAETLWNAVENNEKSADARLAREIEVALPAELTRAEQIKLVTEYAQKNFVSRGMCADVAVHDKRDGNPHAHIMLTMRPFDDSGRWIKSKFEKVYLCKNEAGEERGFTAKELADAGDGWEKQLPYYPNGDANKKPLYLTKSEAQSAEYANLYERVKGKKDPKTLREHKCDATVKEWDAAETLERWRAEWAKNCNDVFDKLQISERIDHRSYERQGVDKEPTVHLGAAAKHMKTSDAAAAGRKINDEVREANRLTEEHKAAIEAAQKEIDLLQTRLVAHTYGINPNVENDDYMQLGITVADRLTEEWAQYMKADMELQGHKTATARVEEYRRKAAATGEKHGEHAKLGKEIKTLRERFSETGIFGNKERERLTERINALTKRRNDIAVFVRHEYGVSPESLRKQSKEYLRIADTLEANLMREQTGEEREKNVETRMAAFIRHCESIAELPAAREIFGLFDEAKEAYEKRLLANKQEHYDTETYYKNAAARIERTVAAIPVKARSGGGETRYAAAKINLIIDLRENIKVRQSRGYERWAKLFNLKQAAQTLIYLEENGLASYGKLSAAAESAKSELTEIRAKITDAERRLKDNAAMQKHLRQYARTRAVYDGYKKSGYSKQYRLEHEKDISEHQAAKKFFGGFDAAKKGLPKTSDLKKEYAAILAEKKALYPKYGELKARTNDVVTAKKNIDLYLDVKSRTFTRAETRNRQSERSSFRA